MKRLFSLVLIGVLCFVLGSYLTQSHQAAAVTPYAVATEISAPVEVSIASAGIQVPVTQGGVVDNQWILPESTAAFWKTDDDNTVIYAHNTKQLFGNLKKAQIGADVSLTTANGDVSTYQITAITRVKSSDIEAIYPSTGNTLVLYTCIGLFDSQRLVVYANKSESKS